MKKILILFIFIAFPLALNAQLSGSGTLASPYSGTFEGDLQWNGTNFTNGKVFIGGDVTIDDEELIIGAGMKIIFVAEGTDLIITATGRLTADGTSSNKITFTADDDDDGTYGETGETWGHISFQSMGSAGASLFDNCIIEYGDVRGNSSPASYGGGIYADFNSITISNCKIQHNKAEWGGGLFVNQNRSPYISNCIFFDNFSKEGGGGIYTWNGSNPIIENSIFDSNHCDGTSNSIYTGGGLAAQSNCSLTINNCTFVNNTSSRVNGQSLMFYASANDKAINCIFWGSGSHLYLGGTYTVNYCAIQGSAPSGTGNFVLNSSNTAIDGPNFTDPVNHDFTLQFVSPCRDSGTSTGAPSTDYLGNSRIGLYDIGAYEVQYSYWNGAANTSWSTSSNWDGNVDPSTGTGDVIVPSGLVTYPTSSSNPSFTIGTGKQMILNPGAKATLGTLTNNGTLKLESDATNLSSLIVGSFSGNAATVELYLTGGEAGSKNYRWHYISTPVTTLPVSTFTTVTPDIVRYYDSRVSTDLVQGWVAYDGWIYAAGTFGGPTFTSLIPGLGYDFYDGNNNKFTFSGQLNTADVPMALDYAGGANNGFNLLGNPFSSGLDWDYIISQPGFPTNTSKGLYFTRDNSLCSYIAGVGSPSDVSGYIPPMQGFFTKTDATGNTITLASAAKTHSLHARYKGTEIIPLIRLSLADDTLSDETVVRFDEKASGYLDNDFDAVKIFYSTEYTSIYTALSDIKYVINGQPYPETTSEIPVGLNLLTTGNHSITATQLQGLDNYDVYLIDNITGFTANLKTNPVLTFTASAGTIPGRFILKFTNALTGIEDPAVSKLSFNIYHGLDNINIQTLSDDWDGLQGSVIILDMTGREITDMRNIEFVKNSLIRVPSPDIKGMYVVELKSGMKRYVGKVVIK